MGRSAEPPDPVASSLADFAVGLQALRRAAGGPSFEELGRRTGEPAADLAAAETGRIVPSFAITLAFVRACSGDENEWARRWHVLQERLGEEAERAAARHAMAQEARARGAGSREAASSEAASSQAVSQEAGTQGGQGGGAQDGAHGADTPEAAWLNVTPAEAWLAMASSLPSGEPLPPDEPLRFGERPPVGQLLPPDEPVPVARRPDELSQGRAPAAEPVRAQPPPAEPPVAADERPRYGDRAAVEAAAEPWVRPGMASSAGPRAGSSAGSSAGRGVQPGAGPAVEPAAEPVAQHGAPPAVPHAAALAWRQAGSSGACAA